MLVIMILSKLYTNKPNLFTPIEFVDGVNVVIAEIRLPENQNKDTHNLGKTTVGKVIDFCLLMGKNSEFFLFKYPEIFKDFIFFIEIKRFEGDYITIKRSVSEATLISIKSHNEKYQNFVNLQDSEWDHCKVTFEKSKSIIDGLLNLQAVKPWDYRKGLGYQLRSQDDYSDVYALSKFTGRHKYWKPYLAHIMGFKSINIDKLYDEEELSSIKETELSVLKSELGGYADDEGEIQGKLQLKINDISKKQKFLDDFDFSEEDKFKTEQLVENVNSKISRLNIDRYYLRENKKKIEQSLDNGKILFDTSETEKLFNEAGVLFSGQLKRDFDQLISFNKSLSTERKKYLKQDLKVLLENINKIEIELDSLKEKQIELHGFIKEKNLLSKFKQTTNEVVEIKSDIKLLERQEEYIFKLKEIKAEIVDLNRKKDGLCEKVRKNYELVNLDIESLFSKLRISFSEIVEGVISRKALLNIKINSKTHFEFKSEILDETGNVTSADLGNSYKKLLCIAFDMALASVYSEQRFPKFMFHDGVFESLDDRKKENLLLVIRKQSKIGIQHIITLIDTDLPKRLGDNNPVFSDREIILTLHDEGIQGRIFKTKSW